jgi:XTP/dITP diphosphohydrolase
MKFVVATFNPGKLRELRELLALPEVTLVSLDEFPGATPPVETGATLEENAIMTARAALNFTGMAAIADDTALEIDVLRGRPGIHSARFAGPRATDDQNLARLLEQMNGVPTPRRSARFRSVCVACFGDGTIHIGRGVLEGRIAAEPRGSLGFGYDPVFEIPELGRTLAELSLPEKNAISHRARAVQALAGQLAIGQPHGPREGGTR